MLPAGHPVNPRSILASWEIVGRADLETADCPMVAVEPLAWWRAYVLRARQLLEIAAELGRGKEPSAEAWGKLNGFTEEARRARGLNRAPAAHWLDNPHWRLAENINWWLDLTGVAPYVVADHKAFRTQLWSYSRGVIGLLAIQLLFAVNRAEALVICSGCGKPYPARRVPLKGKRVGRSLAKRNYCDECKRKRVPQRDAARDYRTRKLEVQDRG